MEFHNLYKSYDKDPGESVSKSHLLTEDALLLLVKPTAIGF